MTIVFVGIGLAKNVFALHGLDVAGMARLVRLTVRREQAAGDGCHLPRGVLSEFGQVMPQRAKTVRLEAATRTEGLPQWAQTACMDLLAEIRRLDEQIDTDDQHIRQMAQAVDPSKRRMGRPGIGPTTASALLAAIGNRQDFHSGRQVAARLGLVPWQYSSAGKHRLGHSTKAGDGYLCTPLILGSRTLLAAANGKLWK